MKEIFTSISYPYEENDFIYVNSSIHLEPISLSHHKELYKKLDKNRAYLKQTLVWAEAMTKESLERFIESCIDKRLQGHSAVYLIKYQEQIVGSVGLEQIQRDNVSKNGLCDIGYYLLENYQGKGIIGQVLSALTSIYYVKDNISRFQLQILPSNTKSIRVAERLGAKLEGRLRKYKGHKEMLFFSYILPDDFINRNQEVQAQINNPTGQVEIGLLDLPSANFENSSLETLTKPKDLIHSSNLELEESNVESSNLEVVLPSTELEVEEKVIALTETNIGVTKETNFELQPKTKETVEVTTTNCSPKQVKKDIKEVEFFPIQANSKTEISKSKAKQTETIVTKPITEKTFAKKAVIEETVKTEALDNLETLDTTKTLSFDETQDLTVNQVEETFTLFKSQAQSSELVANSEEIKKFKVELPESNVDFEDLISLVYNHNYQKSSLNTSPFKEIATVTDQLKSKLESKVQEETTIALEEVTEEFKIKESKEVVEELIETTADDEYLAD